MPHKCTRCESIFEDGASVILSGCPECGWNKFLFVKEDGSEGEENEIVGDEEKVEQHTVIDESHDHAPRGKIIREIDDIIGPGADRHSVAEEEGERVESVRILGPGSYELNLDSLLDRKEIVMAIKEDGAYALHLGSVFKKDREKGKAKK
ncbi:Zn-ribbon domain-containing protein [Methanolobus halotolerans]|uniref:Zn-ribbon containing protein n=1 Tax=Methanolobus halotolerans TaxID=2052935 RepID=A0A4E0Q6C7_9EURY|nr:Zn-ribbon domain-containing protein [Methanolobus halotolerans]TGC09787.1 hypothetical protein CUN85_05375 [Methanolobus halotolerans]